MKKWSAKTDIGSGGDPLPDVKPDSIADVEIKLNDRVRWRFRLKLFKGETKREFAYDLATQIYNTLGIVVRGPIIVEPSEKPEPF